MKICFVTKERLSEFWERTGGEDADLIFFPLFDDVTVSYERELKGETAYFEDSLCYPKPAAARWYAGTTPPRAALCVRRR